MVQTGIEENTFHPILCNVYFNFVANFSLVCDMVLRATRGEASDEHSEELSLAPSHVRFSTKYISHIDEF